MKKYFIYIFLVLAVSANSQGLRTLGKKIVNSNSEEVLLKGVGLGGWMLQEGYMMNSSGAADTQHEFIQKLTTLIGADKTAEFYANWRNNFVTKQDVDSIAKWGYNSIRLPMHYNLFTLPIEEELVAGENTWLNTGFDMVDELLTWCESNQIYLILDLHAAPGGQGKDAAISDYDDTKPSLWESEFNKSKTVALWGKLAERYKDKQWIGGYDLLNEVNWPLGTNVLRDLYVRITNEIRAVDANHILFIEGNGFANDFSGLTPPWDSNMVYSPHKYWTYNDTASMQWVLDIREQHNVPLWLGESGENSNAWFTEAINLFEDNNIGWAWWPWKRIETITCPYSINSNSNYEAIIKYWKGEGP
ncbi:MAG: endoglucanase, partial [Ulvibacter sp.]